MTGDLLGSQPASLYIHVPFCTKKCPYCHFFVLPDSKEARHVFLKALEREWHLRAPLLQGKELVSIYFGGGTPSLLTPEELQEILSWIRTGPALLSPSIEITLEANPEQICLDRMIGFQQAGINRVSMGVQSFDDDLLLSLGRTHSSQKAIEAALTIQSANISNLSIDLMYDLPGQTLNQWTKSLEIVKDLPITHLSLYNLIFEPGSVFYKQKKTLSTKLPSEEESFKMLELACAKLPQMGLLRYEISAFAKPGSESVHNSGYWTARPFIGLGPSAFSYLEGRRFRNIPHLQKYAAFLEEGKAPEDFEEKLASKERQKELLAIELRLLKGVDLSLFEQTNGALTQELRHSIEVLLHKNWLTLEGKKLRLTEEGRNFYDSVAIELI